MEQNSNPRFPEQSEPLKVHGTTDDSGQKEKYLRDSGKIEDLPEGNNTAKTNVGNKKNDRSESAHLTDRSGEEKEEDYINTDERKKDIDKRR